jgi:hypothetical protein
MSSKGEMKMSLKLMTYWAVSSHLTQEWLNAVFVSKSYILMPQVFEQLQLSVCSLGQDRCAEGLHNLLDSDRLSCELIFGRAACVGIA